VILKPAFVAGLAFAALYAGAALAAGVPTEQAPEATAPVYPAGFRSDEIAFSLSPASDAESSELEYLVRMSPGQTLVYAWSVEGELGEDDFFTDFHGHTAPGEAFRVMTYRETMGRQGQGALVAPFAGTHGWFFQNRSMKPVKVRLRMSGFYELRSLRETVLEEGSEQVPFGPPRPVE
jgi:hypothetical protein